MSCLERIINDVLQVSPKLMLICSISSSDNLQKEDTALGSIAIYQVVMDDNYPNMIDFCNIQSYLIIDGFVYLILWKLDFPPRGM